MMDFLVAFIVINLTGFAMTLAGLLGLGYTSAPRWPKIMAVAGLLVMLIAWPISIMLDARVV